MWSNVIKVPFSIYFNSQMGFNLHLEYSMNECIIFYSKRAFVITITACVQSNVMTYLYCCMKSSAKCIVRGIVCEWAVKFFSLSGREFISFFSPTVCNGMKITGYVYLYWSTITVWNLWLKTMCLHTRVDEYVI